jgi:hypothetical protein
MKTCTVYFFQVGTEGPVKIGRTNRSPLSRLADLQVSMPFDLRVVALQIGVPVHRETELHRRFAHLNIRGEWFRPGHELMEFIRCNAEPWIPEKWSEKPPPRPRSDLERLKLAAREMFGEDL